MSCPGELLSCTGDPMPWFCSLARHAWAPGAAPSAASSAFLALRVEVLAAPGTFVLCLCPQICIPGWEQSPVGLLVMVWFGSFMGLTRCCPSAACSRSVASTLQAAQSLPCVVSLAPARGRGLVSLLSPRGITHTPAGLSRSTRLHQLAGRALSHPQPCSSQLCRRLGDARRHPGCCRRVSSVTGSKQGERRASPCSGLAPLLACPQPGQDPRVALGRAVPCTSLLPACSPPLCGMGRAPGLATVGRETGSSVGRAQRGND